MRYERASDLETWKTDPRVAARGFNHPWTSFVAPGNGEDLFLDLLEAHLDGAALAIDVGCGHGELAMRMAARCERVVGIDADGDYIALARELAAERKIHNVEFHQVTLERPTQEQPAHSLPVPDASVDLVVCRRGPGIGRWAHEVLRTGAPNVAVLGLSPTGTGVAPLWANDLPRPLSSYFESFPFDVVRSWTAGPAENADLRLDSEWWLDVPEVFETALGLYERLTAKTYDDPVPAFEAVKASLSALAQPVVLRHQRYMWKLTR